MKLNGPQIGELTEIVRTSFSRSDLTILVRTKLDIVLGDQVATDEGWRSVAFNLIDNLNHEDRVIEFVRVVREARPKDSALIASCDRLLSQMNGTPVAASADTLRKAIVAFNDGFQQRNELFKYLNAYKQLHDVLHELQSFYLKITEAVASRKANPGQPLEDDVAFFLEDHVKLARDSIPDTEFPDKPPSWIDKLAAAVDVIVGSDTEKMTRQVERLKALPSEGLGPMNDKLFENASRLQPKQLAGSLNDILSALATSENPAQIKLRSSVEEFRGLCSELNELINAHNLCQKIDASFQEADGLPSVTTEELSDWSIARKSMDELALQRKNDKRVQRTNEAAKLFEAANQAQAFHTLVERFNDLFMQTDKALLRVTNKLPAKALDLHKALKEFQ